MAAVLPASPVEPTAIDREGTLKLALLLVLPVIAFEQFLHTSPAAQSGSPGYETMYWLSDALLALPFAALAVWAGGRIADRLGFGALGVWSVFARAGAIALVFSIALIPGWLLHDEVDVLARTTAVASGHSHGSDEVHWAGDAVFRALILVPLAAAAVWGGDRIGGRLSRWRAQSPSLLARAATIAVLLAVALTSAWFLERLADAADSGEVTYTSATLQSHSRALAAHSHGGFAHVHAASISATEATTAETVAANVAHALRDGLAGQAVGLPVIFLALLWRTRRRPLGSTPDLG